MATTSFRLTPEDEAILEAAAERYGSRAGAIRAALRLLALEQQRRDSLHELRLEWEEDLGPADPADVEALRRHLRGE